MKKTFIDIHYTVWFLIILSYFTGTLKYLLLVYLCMLIHELAHIAAAALFKIPPVYIGITAFGIAIRLKYDIIKRPIAEICIAAAGPAASLLCGFFCYHSYPYFALSSIAAGAVNLIPCINTDGGRILSVLLCRIYGKITGYKVFMILSKLFLALLFLAGIYILYITRMNASLLLIVGFLSYTILTEGQTNKMFMMKDTMDYRNKKSKDGTFSVKTIGIYDDVPFRRILKKLSIYRFCVIEILDHDMNIVTSISEKQAVDYMLHYGAGVTGREIIRLHCRKYG